MSHTLVLTMFELPFLWDVVNPVYVITVPQAALTKVLVICIQPCQVGVSRVVLCNVRQGSDNDGFSHVTRRLGKSVRLNGKMKSCCLKNSHNVTMLLKFVQAKRHVVGPGTLLY